MHRFSWARPDQPEDDEAIRSFTTHLSALEKQRDHRFVQKTKRDIKKRQTLDWAPCITPQPLPPRTLDMPWEFSRRLFQGTMHLHRGIPTPAAINTCAWNLAASWRL